MLKPQDVVVLLKLVVTESGWTHVTLAEGLGMSASGVRAALDRASRCGLYSASARAPNRKALLELLVHGLRYVFPAERGAMTRGTPTAHAAPPLSAEIASSGDPPPVWPDAEGAVRGETFLPLHSCVTLAARRDARLYELLALVDAIRGGRARERSLAVREVQTRLA